MGYLDDNLPDFSALSLPEDGLLFSDSPSVASSVASPAASGGGIGLGTAIKAGSSIMAGVGAYMQGQEMAGAYEYNASLELMKGQFEVEEISGEEAAKLSTQKAEYAKAGVEQSGSVLDVALNTATNMEYDKQVAMFNAKSAAAMDDYEAKMAKSKGDMGLSMGILGAAVSLL